MVQAIVLAAGESSRFKPLSDGKHKSLLKLMGKYLIEYTVESALKVASEAIIVSSPNDAKTFKKIFAKNKKVKIAIQEQSKGMGNAIICASPLIKNNFFVLSASDKFDANKYMKQMISKQKQTKAGIILLSMCR